MVGRSEVLNAFLVVTNSLVASNIDDIQPAPNVGVSLFRPPIVQVRCDSNLLVSSPSKTSGFECRRVFPAGVRPGSPSRDAANCLSSRFSWSVETRRRYGWLRMVFTRCASLPSSSLLPFGRWWHARGRGHYREKPGVLSEYAPDLARRARGSSIVDEPEECGTPVRENHGTKEVTEGKADR